MSDELVVQLSPAAVQLEPGGTPVEVTITVENRGDAPAEYSIELTGLDGDWFTSPPSIVRLFPLDRDQLRFTLRPPRRAGRGNYVYRVLVRSRTSAAQETAEGTLELTGTAAYRLELTPRRLTARNGAFQVQLVNTGTADVTINLDAHDAEGACELRFGREGGVRVPAGQRVQVPLKVIPRERPFIGDERRYDFSVSARPDEASVAPQSVPGQFTYRPAMRSWRPIRRTVMGVVGVVVALMVILAFIPAGIAGSVGAVRVLCGIPIIGALCGRPAPEVACTYDHGFQVFAQTESQLIGNCLTPALDDPHGNVRQYTRNGMLFWQRQTNEVFFFGGDSVWGFTDQKSTLLHGSGATR